MMTHDDWRALAAQASTLDERLSQGCVPLAGDTPQEPMEARLDAWCQAVAHGDWEQFDRRLAWDGLERAQVRRVLGAVRLPPDAPLPAWVETVQAVLRCCASLPADALPSQPVGGPRWRFLNPQEPLPFEEVLLPFVLVASERLAEQVGRSAHRLTDLALATLQRDMLETLSAYAAQALYLEFSIFRAQAHSPLERLLVLAHPQPTRTLYERFVAGLLQGGLAAFFQEYAVLARLLATITDRWVGAAVEALQRLDADWPLLQQHFGGAEPLGLVSAVRPALSDPHRGRRRVMALTFASGRTLIYKPKDLGTEAAFGHLLAWRNAQGAPLPFRVLTVLNRGRYGWVECVEPAPCQDETAARRYYQRAGMLLCLLYVLEATDCHRENLLASGEDPMLIDLETLLHPTPRLDAEDQGSQAQLLAQQQLAYSVLRTGLLPTWQVSQNGRVVFDVSGLGSDDPPPPMSEQPQWQQANTDQMTLTPQPVPWQRPPHVPHLGEQPLRVEDYAQELLDGFQQGYHFLLEQRERLLAPEGPLSALADQQVRFLYRNTRGYGMLLQRLRAPAALRDGAEQSLQLEHLWRAVLPLEGPLRARGQPPRWWPLVAAERQALIEADIPLFTAQTTETTLNLAPGLDLDGCLEGTAFERVLARLRALDQADMERQIALIQGALYAYVAREERVQSALSASSTQAPPASAAAQPSTEQWLAQALLIARQMEARAIRAADGSVAWIAPRYLSQAERLQLESLSFSLYDGTAGVALFLAALEYVTGGAGYRDLALGALHALRQMLAHYPQRAARELGIGGALGLGSVVYALTRSSQWLAAPLLLEAAQQAAALITPERIAQDGALDILAGAAGALLGLLTLHAAAPDPATLASALACGQHLLQARRASAEGQRAWPSAGQTMLTGFAHGAAGIAYALLRLYTVTGDQAYLDAAAEGIAYEDQLFAPDALNWLDLPEPGKRSFWVSWCHGAPGIGLARLGGLAALDTAEIQADITAALHTAQHAQRSGPAHLCCGALGRAELLLEAARRLARPELAASAEQLAGQVVAEAEQVGRFVLDARLPPHVDMPGFFQGTAGIGYTFLRLASPDRLPSVLLWD